MNNNYQKQLTTTRSKEILIIDKSTMTTDEQIAKVVLNIIRIVIKRKFTEVLNHFYIKKIGYI